MEPPLASCLDKLRAHFRKPRGLSCRDCSIASSALVSEPVSNQPTTVPVDAVQELVLYNSLTRRKEAFKPRAADGVVSMYVVSFLA